MFLFFSIVSKINIVLCNGRCSVKFNITAFGCGSYRDANFKIAVVFLPVLVHRSISCFIRYSPKFCSIPYYGFKFFIVKTGENCSLRSIFSKHVNFIGLLKCRCSRRYNHFSCIIFYTIYCFLLDSICSISFCSGNSVLMFYIKYAACLICTKSEMHTRNKRFAPFRSIKKNNLNCLIHSHFLCIAFGL